MNLPYQSPGWKTAPISPTCEQLEADVHTSNSTVPIHCGKPTEWVYPAHGGGWMALCAEHGKKHLPHAFNIDDAIKSGETFDLAPMGASDLMAICGECCAILTDEEMCAGYEVNEKPACQGCWQAAADENP